MKFTLLFLLIAFGIQAQKEVRTEKKQKALEEAKANLNQLKSGFLLVRLEDKKTEIDYYLKYNNVKEANKIKEEQAE